MSVSVLIKKIGELMTTYLLSKIYKNKLTKAKKKEEKNTLNGKMEENLVS